MIGVLEVVLLGTMGLSNAPYARTHVDPNDPNSHCLWWHDGPVSFTQSAQGNPSTQPSGSEFPAVTRAWQTWQAVHGQCGNLMLSEGAQTPGGTGSPGRTIGYDQQSNNNTNLILFRETLCSSVVPSGDPCSAAGNCNNVYDCWGNSSSIIALTTTTFTVSTGQILDADVEMNAAQFHFTATTAESPTCTPPVYSNCVYTDVQNTMTHEFGHVHGLDHTSYVDMNTGKASIMNPTAPPGETAKRVIDPPTMGFVCNDAYPKGLPSHDCVARMTPPNGGHGCSQVPGLPIGALGWMLLMLRKRRRFRSALA